MFFVAIQCIGNGSVIAGNIRPLEILVHILPLILCGILGRGEAGEALHACIGTLSRHMIECHLAGTQYKVCVFQILTHV